MAVAGFTLHTFGRQGLFKCNWHSAVQWLTTLSSMTTASTVRRWQALFVADGVPQRIFLSDSRYNLAI
jgi:hypothetical protein